MRVGGREICEWVGGRCVRVEGREMCEWVGGRCVRVEGGRCVRGRRSEGDV